MIGKTNAGCGGSNIMALMIESNIAYISKAEMGGSTAIGVSETTLYLPVEENKELNMVASGDGLMFFNAPTSVTYGDTVSNATSYYYVNTVSDTVFDLIVGRLGITGFGSFTATILLYGGYKTSNPTSVPKIHVTCREGIITYTIEKPGGSIYAEYDRKYRFCPVLDTNTVMPL